MALPPAPGPTIKKLAENIGLDRHGIGDAIDLGDDGGDRHHWSDARAARCRVGALGDAEQLDAVAEIGGGLDVLDRDVGDALEIDVVGRDRRAEGEAGRMASLWAVSLPSISKVGSASA